MANTEGMSDEFIQSLTTTTTTGATRATMAPMTAEERRRRRFQERMDMPLGDTPAAKVVVRSARDSEAKKKKTNTGTEKNTVGAGRVRFADEEVGEESSTMAASSPDAAAATATISQSQSNSMSMFANGNPMIGEIKEHSQKPVVKKKKKIISDNDGSSSIASRGVGAEGGKQQSFSRFSQQNQQVHGQARSRPISSIGSAGFPSLNVPMGTFVRKKTTTKSLNEKTAPRNGAAPSTTNEGTNSSAIATRTTTTTSTSIISMNNDFSSSDNNIQDASQKDADRMISSFSVDEIRQYQQEIHSSLSPDMIEFLKKRRSGKKDSHGTLNESGTHKSASSSSSYSSFEKNNKDVGDTKEASDKEATSEPQDDSGDIPYSKIEESIDGDKQKEREEKERIANIISSVRTHEDLDSVYESEMKQPHPLSHEEGDDKNHVVSGRPHDDHDGDTDEKFLLACDLLRSTARRQTLWAARIVSLELSKMVQSQQQQQQQQQHGSSKEQDDQHKTTNDEKAKSSPLSTPSSLPILLSVSLRCLLDKPISSRYLLHTYALQALYSLSLIYSTPKDGGILTMSDEQIYQIYFMDDAVPSRSMQDMYAPVNVQPLKVDNYSTGDSSSSSSAASAAAYATSSSSASAMTDAQAFKKDPMWTLLSKMKIIPRMSFLIQQFDIPVEAWIAICRLLEMLGRRSPGAASAIVQHEHLIPNIHKRMLQELHNRTSDQGQLDVTLVSIRMFCTLARQSKAVAEKLPLEDILPPLLALEASSSGEYQAQQLALVMWRTSLRYGYGLPALASMLTFSTRSFALPYSNQYSLSSDFISGFTEVIECSRVIASKTPDMISSATKQGKIDEKVLPVAETSAKYLSTVIALLMPKTSTPVSQVEDGLSLSDWAARYRWHGARLSFLSSWIHLTHTVEEEIASIIALPPNLSSDNQISILDALHSWSNVGGDVEKLWKMVLMASFIPTCSSCEDEETKMDASQAAGCAFLNGFFLAVSAFLLFESPDNHIHELKQSLDKKLRTLILDVAKTVFSVGDNRAALRVFSSKSPLRLAKDGWRVQAHYAVAKYLLHATSRGIISSSYDLTVSRSIVFSLLSNLKKGDEAVAAVLFSNDALYQTSGDPLANSSETMTSSPISSMFLGELCSNGNERTQLDHSFKLHHGFGITSDGLGPFGLESLLSTVDRPPTLSSSESEESSKLEGSMLPLDRLWLWQTLSGAVRVNSGNVVKGTKEAKEVVLATLNLLVELEEGEEIAGIIGYSSSIPVGSKLYYVMNVCLQPEDVIRDEMICSTTEAIVRRYIEFFGDTSDDGVIFCEECFNHSNPSKIVKGDDIAHDGGDAEEESTVKDQKVLEKYLNQEQDLSVRKNDVIFPASHIKALEAFVEDLCTAYRDYGAQYSFFTQCIRAFLLPVFPDSIRRRVLQELEDMLNLLTVPEIDEMGSLLQKFILGGLPETDKSCRDNPMMLDAVSTSIERSRSLSRPLNGFTLYFAVAMLARSLSTGISSKDRALISMNKRRLLRLDSSMILLICDAAEHFLESDGTKESLVAAVDAAIMNSDAADAAQGNIDNKQTVDSIFVDEYVKRLVSRDFR